MMTIRTMQGLGMRSVLASILAAAVLISGAPQRAFAQDQDRTPEAKTKAKQEAEATVKEAEKAKKQAEKEAKDAKTPEQKATAERKAAAAQKAIEIANEVIEGVKDPNYGATTAEQGVVQAKRIVEALPHIGTAREKLVKEFGVTNEQVNKALEQLNDLAKGSGTPTRRGIDVAAGNFLVAAGVERASGGWDEKLKLATKLLTALFFGEGKLADPKKADPKKEERLENDKGGDNDKGGNDEGGDRS